MYAKDQTLVSCGRRLVLLLNVKSSQAFFLRNSPSEVRSEIGDKKGVQKFRSASTDKTTVSKQKMIKLETILSKSNLKLAYRQVVENAGAGGIDKMQTDELQSYLRDNWDSLKAQIESGTYHPKAVRRVEIPKPNGGIRYLGIPTVFDRMLQQAIGQQLSNHYDSTFSDYSYGYRKGRDAHQCIDKALEYLNAGYSYIVEIDLSKFFDRVNHDRLLSKLSKRITDKEVLRLIRRYLQSGVMINGVVQATTEGTPQGGNLSPILSNIVLDELDKELDKRGHRYVRYADDISIFVKSRRAGERVLSSITDYIESRLKLRVNRDKSGIKHYTKGGLLGFGFYKDAKGVQCRILESSYKRFCRKLKRYTKRSWSISFDERVTHLFYLINGWVNYYGKAKGRARIRRIDEWLRRRLRMCIWKQWKRIGKRMRSLIQLGASKAKAYQWSNTRKSYWRISKSPILQRTITTDRLEQRGYISILKKYNHRHSILMNRRGTRTVCQVV